MTDARTDARRAVERVVREESGAILAALTRATGDLDRADDALQDACAAALAEWSESGTPGNPAAWLTTVARRRAIDRVRREAARGAKQAEAVRRRAAEYEERLTAMEPALPDDRLRLLCLCCHPALRMDARVALTLRMLGGLTTAEIAHAFLLPEATIAQRIVRAKRKIRAAKIPLRVPADDQLEDRVAAVMAVLYLVFNEGYAATSGDAVVRRELCADAIRLGRDLVELVPRHPDAEALLALMLLHDARRAARAGPDGALIRIPDQDRAAWDHRQIEEAVAVLDRAMERGAKGTYALQAAIAALHVQAPTAAETDWKQIAALYDTLLEQTQSPVVALNRAVAIAETRGAAAGLEATEPLRDALDSYVWLHTTRGELLRRLERNDEARACFERAQGMVRNESQARFVAERIAALGGGETRA